jgi:hypothetical protein
MHLLVDISAHGLGHLAQTAPVIEALQVRVPELRLTIRSALPRLRLDQSIASQFDYVDEARDFGFVMYNAVDIDFSATAKAYIDFHRSWSERVSVEADWLRAHRIDAVLTNVAYLPLAASACAGLPSASMCSINWADLFLHYFAAEAWAGKIYEEMLSAYRDACCFLRVSPGLPMTKLDNRQDIGPIARLGKGDRQRLSRQLGLAGGNRWILIAMGGMEFRLPVESWRHIPGFSWLVPNAWNVRREDVRPFDSTCIDFANLLASVDAVITKPGYGILVEAACNGVPILYLQRDDWPETPYLSAWLAKHARSAVLGRARLMKGDFTEELAQLWADQAPDIPLVTGVDEAVESLQAALRLP